MSMQQDSICIYNTKLMNSLKPLSSHYIIKNGHFIPKERDNEYHEPQNVHYNHTIRILNLPCNHNEEIEKLKAQYESKLEKKNIQIKALTQLIHQKNQQMQSNILSSRSENSLVDITDVKNTPFKLSKQNRIPDTKNSGLFGKNSSKLNHSSISRNQSDLHTPSHNRINKTNQLVSTISKALNVKRPKYVFFNKQLEALRTPLDSCSIPDTDTQQLISEFDAELIKANMSKSQFRNSQKKMQQSNARIQSKQQFNKSVILKNKNQLNTEEFEDKNRNTRQPKIKQESSFNTLRMKTQQDF